MKPMKFRKQLSLDRSANNPLGKVDAGKAKQIIGTTKDAANRVFSKRKVTGGFKS